MISVTTRQIVFLDIPIAEDTEILRPEQVVLRFASSATFDIGALCYLKREPVPQNGPGRRATGARKVVISSLCLKRAAHVRSIIVYISDAIRLGNRPQTMLDVTRKLGVFINWADENGFERYYADHELARKTVLEYAKYVRERVVTNLLSLHSGATLQKIPITHFSEILGIDNLGKGINLLRRDKHTVTPTSPPDAMAQARTLSLCEALFVGLSNLILEGRPYPHGIAMPSHLHYPKNTMWVFPSNVWCLPSSKLHQEGVEFRRGGFDYREGRLVSREEILSSDRKDRKKRVNGVLGLAEAVLDKANGELRHRHRRFMGMVALNAFIHLFLSRTGMNWAQAVELQWPSGDGEQVAVIRQKFRSIKFRAGGKYVYFQLPINFMPLFKRFLKVRNFLLQGCPEFSGLFFNLGINAVGTPSLIKSAMPGISTMLRRIDPSFVQIRSRAWRAAKSDWLLTRTDVATTAQLLQNSEQTVLQSYAAGSVQSHQIEMSAFLDGIVISGAESSNSGEITAVGACIAHGSPATVLGVAATVTPNCDAPEAGCLFCDKFKVHADETDVRKLLSCRYTLARTSHLAGFHETSEPLIARIDLILEQLERRDQVLVYRIRQEVDEGELDPYWSAKFDFLLKLRLVNDID